MNATPTKTGLDGTTDHASSDLGADSSVLTEFQTEMARAGRGRDLVVGDYVLLDEIGRGGMGRVFRAYHRYMRRTVALKILDESLAFDAEAVQRFECEVWASSRIAHENVVTAYDAGETCGLPYLVTEYVEGTDLAQLVRTSGPLTVRESLELVLQAARGLEAVHAAGIVHRDVKPANLLLGNDGRVQLIDFGMARILELDTFEDPHVLMGTYDYMSPEQTIDPNLVDPRSDVYSLGCTLFRLLTGRALFESGSIDEKLEAHRAHPSPSLRALRDDVPEAVESLFRRMIAKRRGHRIPMKEVVVVIDDLLRALPTEPSGSRVTSSIGTSTGSRHGLRDLTSVVEEVTNLARPSETVLVNRSRDHAADGSPARVRMPVPSLS